jgi:uncharacterized cupredoxin-like copper-binding protein
MRRVSYLIVLTIVLAALASCGNEQKAAAPEQAVQPSAQQAAGGKVAVTVGDFKIGLAQATIPAGKVTFAVAGAGPSAHEMVLFRTDLDQTKLPTSKDGTKVDEEGPGVRHVDEVEDITAGSTKDLTVDLQPGRYVLVCNIPGHYKLGMHTVLTVS